MSKSDGLETVRRVAKEMREFSEADVTPEWDLLDTWRDDLEEACNLIAAREKK